MWLSGVSAWCIGGLSDGIHLSSGLSHFWGRTQHFTLEDPAEDSGADNGAPGRALAAWCLWGWGYGGRYHGLGISRDCHSPAEREDRDLKRETSKESSLSGCGARQDLAVLAVPLASTAPHFPSHHLPSSCLWIIPVRPAGAGGECFIVEACGGAQFRMRMPQHLLGWLGPSGGWGEREGRKP